MQNKFSLPTKDEPTKLGIVSFFFNRIQFNDNVFKFDDISIINFNSRISSTNFISTRYLTFFIVGTNEKDGKEYQINLTNPNRSNMIAVWVTKKFVEKYSILYNYIAKATFQTRLSKYLSSLDEKGYFLYAGCEFHKNGDLIKNAKVITNLITEFSKGTISWGSSWQGINNSSQNPFEFSILYSSEHERTRIFGFELDLKFKIETYDNHDIFMGLLTFMQKNKRYPSVSTG